MPIRLAAHSYDRLPLSARLLSAIFPGTIYE
jgi:hypothetical protein